MKILVGGSSGLIGSALALSLADGGHDVTRLVRTLSADGGQATWNPDEGTIDARALEGFDAVIHLGGVNIASGRWTRDRQRRIRNSRVNSTQLLCDTLAELNSPPHVIVCASATGFYGDRKDELLDEESESGAGFLAEVCRDWETATIDAQTAGIRIVNLRLGMVLSTRSGALAEMLLPFRLGLGGRIGTGNQYWSWVALDDAINAIAFTLTKDSVNGPVNCVAPQPVTNGEFTRCLATVLRRPALIPIPAFALRSLFGKMADELLLASVRAIPQKLLDAGFEFRHPRLSDALSHVLKD